MDRGILIGTFPDTIKHTLHYLMERGCFLDCRGLIDISDTTIFGYDVKMLTMSHDISDASCGKGVKRRLRIDGNSWIASFSLLAACWVQEHAVVCAGSVVTGVIVPAYSMVQGNPAQIVATYDRAANKWVRLPEPRACESWSGRKV